MTTVSHSQRFPRVTLSAVTRDALAAAEDRVAGRHGPGTGGDTGDIRTDLRRISESVCALVTQGHPPKPVRTSRPLPRWLIDAFRTEFIAYLTDRAPARLRGNDLLAVFAALEEIACETVEPAATFGRELAQSDVLQGMRGIAHDMRSPLGAILLLVEPIRKGQKGPVTPVQERQLGLIYGAALSLSTLVNDILEAARGEHRAASASRPFSIRGTIEDACAVVRPIAEEKQLELRTSCSAADGRIGDAAALNRVVLNLVTNALKYTESGWVSIECRALDETRVEFAVEDTGTGMPEGALAMLFQGMRPGPGGLQFSSAGLGLAICRTLLENMGGALSVETAEGGGSRFSFQLDLPCTAGGAEDQRAGS
jgi:signal transduction histidine kinase